MSTRRAPRVVMVVENNGYSSDQRVRYEALALTDAGYDVSVIAPAEDGQPCREIVDGVQVLRYPPGPRGEGALSYLVEYAYATAVSLVLVIRAMVTVASTSSTSTTPIRSGSRRCRQSCSVGGWCSITTTWCRRCTRPSMARVGHAGCAGPSCLWSESPFDSPTTSSARMSRMGDRDKPRACARVANLDRPQRPGPRSREERASGSIGA